MNKDKIIISALVILIVATLFGIFRGPRIVVQYPELPLGSADATCTYTNITSTNASGTIGTLIRKDGGVLCSLTIASSSPAVTSGFRLYDGGTTATTSATLIGKFKTDGSEETHPLYFSLVNGLVVDVPPGFVGSFIIGTR